MIRRILVTGPRDWPDARIGDIGEHLMPIAQRNDRIVLVHGGARGVDKLADSLWRNWGMVTPEVWHAPWNGPCAPDWKLDPQTDKPWCGEGHRCERRDGGTYCPRMGHRRNQHMVNLGADAAFAFILNGSAGALDCARRAEAAGIPTTRIERDL